MVTNNFAAETMVCCRHIKRGGILQLNFSRWMCGLQVDVDTLSRLMFLMFGLLFTVNQAATPPTVISGDEGKSIILPCLTEAELSSGGVPDQVHKIEWYSPTDSQELLLQDITGSIPVSGPWLDSNRGTILTNSSLEIFSASIDDSGVYFCKTYSTLNELLDRKEVELIVHDASPKIDPLERTSLIENETLTLTCRGGFYVTWHYPKSVESRVHIAITTHIEGTSRHSWTQTSALTIDHVLYTDTGEYLCAHHHSADEHLHVGDALYDTVYIYVTGPKETTALFVPTSQTTVTAYADDNSISVPCRVTDPAAKVTLTTEPSPGRILEISSLESTTYDPKSGFLVQEQLQSFGDELICWAQVEQTVDEQMFIFNYIGKPDIMVQSPANKAINSTSSELIIAESDLTVELVCEGQLPLIWFYPDRALSKISVQSTATLNPLLNTGLLYRSVLTVGNITASETGEYSCVMVKYVNGNSEDELRRVVYVYVTSTDIQNLFLPVQDRIVKVYPDRSFTVPCRISNPEYVSYVYFDTLIGSSTYNDFKRNRTWVYDPKVGFIFDVQAEGKIIPDLQFYCTVWRDTEYITKDFVLLYFGDNKGTLSPKITASDNVTIIGQSKVNVTCEVSIEERILSRLTSDFYPQFEMHYPAQKHLDEVSSDNYQGSPVNSIQDGNKVFTYTLHIQNITLFDMGTYICEVYNAAGIFNSSTHIAVLEEGYVKATTPNTTQSNMEITKGTRDYCRIKFLVEAFPDVSFEWFKDDQPITMEDMGIEQHRDGPSIYLCINEVQEKHAGLYRMVASNHYQKDTETIQLTVLVKPVVSITVMPEPITDTLPNLFRMGNEYTLNCSATGNPTPIVHWEWYECTSVDGKTCYREPPADKSSWTRVSDEEPGSSENAGVALRHPVSNWMLQVVRRAKLSGWYRCVVQSAKFENTTKVQDFMVTEIDDGFSIEEPDVEVYETQQVELSCKASYYSFKYLRWKRKDPTTNETVFVIDPLQLNRPKNPRVEILDEENDRYSLWSRVSIKRANISDSGKYKCVAKPQHGKRITKEMALKVKALKSPVITGGLQNQTKIDRSKGVHTLRCMASGDPKPDMQWEKDGKVLKKSEPMLSTPQPGVYESSFILASLSDVHEGQYSCTATNLGGSARSVSDILILQSPRAEASEVNVRVKVGMNATLSCKVEGLPEPTMIWHHITTEDKERIVPNMVYRNNGRMIQFKEVTEDDAGVYRCIARNELGEHFDQIVLNIDVSQSYGLETFLIPVIVVAGVLFIVMIILIIIVARKCGTSTKQSVISNDAQNYLEPKVSTVPSYLQDIIDKTPYDIRWEFPRERLQLGSVIGKGAFGMVVKAVAVGIGSSSRSTIVAVKTLRDVHSVMDTSSQTLKKDAAENEYKALMAELKMLIHVGRHMNVVNFLGACTQQSPILVIVKYCRHGNLSHYLRSKREKFIKENGGGENTYTDEPHNNTGSTGGSSGLMSPISRVTRSLEDLLSDESQQDYTRISDEEDDDDDKDKNELTLAINDLICYSFQIARGMEFLASKKCIHRDLAARNVLVADHNVVKICDFGLSRNLYYDSDYIASTKSMLPIKWMAPESIFDKVFTSQSDVWSFGIVMWETFSLGGSPYPGFQVDERFYDKLKAGYRMTIPDYAAAEIYQIMLECWHREPKQRPTFGELVKILGERLEDRTKEEYMDLEAEYEKEYWEIPDSIQSDNSASDGYSSPPADLDEPPDHPPLPVPRTIERKPKFVPTTEVIIETSPVHELSSPSSLKNAADRPSSPSSPENSADGSVPPPALSNGHSSPVNNLEMSRLSFPSDDDLNVTVQMITNPVRSRPSTPTEENALLEVTSC